MHYCQRCFPDRIFLLLFEVGPLSFIKLFVIFSPQMPVLYSKMHVTCKNYIFPSKYAIKRSTEAASLVTARSLPPELLMVSRRGHDTSRHRHVRKCITTRTIQKQPLYR